MDLRGIRAFVRVAELGSITRASRELGIVQPALSRHIQRIELELGTTLLIRLPRGVQLTLEGRRFLQHSRRILHEVAQATSTLAVESECAGRVTIGLSPTLAPLLSPGIIERCSLSFPAITLKISEQFTRHMIGDMLNGQYDIVLLTNPPPSRAFAMVPVLTEPLVVVSGPQRRGIAPALSLDELANTPLLITEGFYALVEDQLACYGGTLRVTVEIDAIEAIRRMVIAGLGSSILPVSVVREDVEAGRMSAASVAGVELTRSLVLVTMGEERTAPAVRAVSGLIFAEIEALAQRGMFSALPAPPVPADASVVSLRSIRG
jgi:LysR family transcriptional regulator, nitrogen assimilation regulatory protein